jgi:antirestriction protein ArdC
VIVPEAEALIGATGADFRIGGDQAFYVPSEDFIRIPNQTSYTDQINYYRTAFHELGHWTGHKTRLDRNLTTKFGTVDYAREELIAELATAFICASLGIVPTVRHSDYIGNWLQVLKEDARAIVKAARLAISFCNSRRQIKTIQIWSRRHECRRSHPLRDGSHITRPANAGSWGSACFDEGAAGGAGRASNGFRQAAKAL